MCYMFFIYHFYPQGSLMFFLVSDGFTVKQTLRWSSHGGNLLEMALGINTYRSEGLGRGRSWVIIQTLWTLWRALEVGWIFNVIPSWGEGDKPSDKRMLNMCGKRWALNTVVFFSWGNPQRELTRMVIFATLPPVGGISLHSWREYDSMIIFLLTMY